MKVFDYTKSSQHKQSHTHTLARSHALTMFHSLHTKLLDGMNEWNEWMSGEREKKKTHNKMESSIFNILVLIDAIRQKVELMTIYRREWWLRSELKYLPTEQPTNQPNNGTQASDDQASTVQQTIIIIFVVVACTTFALIVYWKP